MDLGTNSDTENESKERAARIEGMFKKVCQTAFLIQLNFQSARKEDIKLRNS